METENDATESPFFSNLDTRVVSAAANSTIDCTTLDDFIIHDPKFGFHCNNPFNLEKVVLHLCFNGIYYV